MRTCVCFFPHLRFHLPRDAFVFPPGVRGRFEVVGREVSGGVASRGARLAVCNPTCRFLISPVNALHVRLDVMYDALRQR